ncbi:Ricin-type beta-trefoil lectin domain-containing protein [Actinopolyspora xinjiangensis]|uniref:Ricin-type beta-trefoil lectin domain-containing protein n=1 Tax=Actinopolyspora xinjiangensis TaxID=405564 RepID=A0A1H0WQP2_9ACTN|nr:RICIN domain-containing protein [Actinopolyspora xinjiangensis]SDP93004.1 Ricin-type beta-trefoil lectin domain-containing protein [Actinopolyspora xinjiangensis]
MKPKKRIALVLATAFSLVGIMGAGAGAAEQREQSPQAREARTSIVLGEPYHLYNRSAHLFMLAKAWNTSENGILDLWYQHRTDSARLQEQWEFLPTGLSGVLRIKNVGSGLCLEPNNQDPLRHVVQRQCDRGDRAQWWWVDKDEGLRIAPYNNANRVMNPYQVAYPSRDIVLNKDVDSLSQRWSAIPVE